MATELAKAYVQIVPSAKGIGNSVAKELDAPSSEAGKTAGLNIASKIKGVIATAGIGAALKSALSEGADLQQSIGGIETLFKDSSEKVIANAKEAYRTAGMSANEYMEQTTGFAASLLQSLGGDTAKAADMADVAMRDMSDNANKMGTSMESIKFAYQGFAKQNYTMLDNLKLGYGGTKEEMSRLLADAEKISGVHYDMSNLSDVYSAIHVIQGELDITGTTAKEAATTFTGSIGSMKAAAKNVLGNLMLGDDIKRSLQSLTDSTVTFVNGNLLPAITNIISNMPTAIITIISGTAPRIIASIADAASKIMGNIGKNIGQILSMVLSSVFNIAGTLVDSAPLLVEAAIEMLGGIVEALPAVTSTIYDVIPELVNSITYGLLGKVPEIIECGTKLFMSIVDALPEVITNIVDLLPVLIDGIIGGIMSSLPQIVQAGITLFISLVEAMPQIVETVVDSLPQIIDGITTALLQNIPLIIQTGVSLLLAIIDDLPFIISQISDSMPKIINGVVNGLFNNISKIIQAGIQILLELASGIIKAIPQLVAMLPQIISAIVRGIGSLMGSIISIGKNIVEGIWKGIQNAASWLVGKVTGFFDDIIGGVKDFLGIHSPSTVFAGIGGYMAQGLGKGWDEEYSDISNDIENGLSSSVQRGRNAIMSAVNDISRASAGSFGDVTVRRDYGTPTNDADRLIMAMSNMRVILDSGEVVGFVDAGLNRRRAMSARGV